jgi:mRNA interferase RelE/StbE
MTYSVFIQKSAHRALSRIQVRDQNRIIEAIRALGKSPRPIGSKKLSGRDAWRIRIGDYRVIYEIEDKKLIVMIVAIGHRRDVYR